MTSISRPPETTPDARETAAPARPEQINAPAPAETRVQVAPSPDAEVSLRDAASQIARASSAGPDSSAALRNASEAYQSEAAAQDMAARQQQSNAVDMMA